MTNWQNKSAAELTALVEYHDLRYWVLNAPEISDADYDLLVETLRQKNPEAAPLEEVRSIEVSSSPIRHDIPMLSLQKIYSFAELQTWCAKNCRTPQEVLIFSPKYDGVAGDWDGKILSTRGDGKMGNDISDKISMITLQNVDGKRPLAGFKTPFRGEIIMPLDEFALHKNEFKTPRAAAAGLLGRNEPSDTHSLLMVDYASNTIALPFEKLTPDSWRDICEKFSQLPCPMDGIVISFQDRVFADSLGSSSHHPYGSVAFKFNGECRQSKIVRIHWQINRQDITPVAEIEPVEINGRTISRVTLHNVQFVEREDIQTGDHVDVILSGDVIPKIAGHTPGENRRKEIPSNCPSCGRKLSRRDSRLVCTNQNCEAVIKAMLLDFAGKLKLKRFGTAGCDYLFDLGVRSREDMAEKLLFFRKYGFQSLPEPGEALEEILVSDIYLTDAQKLVACDVFSLGEVNAHKLCAQFSLETVFAHAGDEDFFKKNLSSNARSAVIAQKIGERTTLFKLLQELTLCYGKHSRNKSKTVSAVPNSAAGANIIHADNIPGYPDLDISKVKRTGNGECICLTGKMPWVRAELYKVCQAAGFVPVDRFSSSVSLVLYADISSMSAKMMSASKKGIPIEDILSFVKRINATA
jgi:DNA ligase (NAD+)